MTSEGTRNCWTTARERNRMKARYAIRQRIQYSPPPPTQGVDVIDDNVGPKQNNVVMSHNIQVSLKNQTNIASGTCNNINQHGHDIHLLCDDGTIDQTITPTVPNDECSIKTCAKTMQTVQSSVLCSTTITQNLGSRRNVTSNEGDQEDQRQYQQQEQPQRKHLQQQNFDDNIQDRKLLIQTILQNIVEGDRSYFSLQFMEKNYRILSNPIPTEYLWVRSHYSNDDKQSGSHANNNTSSSTSSHTTIPGQCVAVVGELVGESRLLSWYLHEKLNDLKLYISRCIVSFTILEYTIWIQRYHITGALLLGGINPCLRGSPMIFHNSTSIPRTMIRTSSTLNDDACSSNVMAQQTKVGNAVLKRFFSGVPISLSSYIVKRVVEMRMEFIHRQWKDGIFYSQPDIRCSLCEQKNDHNQLLCFVPSSTEITFRQQVDDTKRSCLHVFCESCFWNDILEYLDGRQNDIVICPVCSSYDADDINEHINSFLNCHQFEDRHLVETNDDDISFHKQLAHDSFTKYLALPMNGNVLKNMKTKKKKISEKDVLSSTWLQAVTPLLGSSQAIRRDKFFSYIETTHYNKNECTLYHFMKGCLEQGIDVNIQNEYGQTALYVASWYGIRRIVQLLLWYGADRSIPAHGELTCIDVARYGGHNDIVNLLQHFLPSPISQGDDKLSKASNANLAPITDQIRNTLRCNCGVSPQKHFLCATEVIDRYADHSGAGSFVIDNVISPEVVDALIQLWRRVPTASGDKIKKKKDGPCSIRTYFCDCECWITTHVAQSALKAILDCSTTTNVDPLSHCNGQSNEFSSILSEDLVVFPHVRFLVYKEPGTALAPHVDLCKLHPWTGQRSTHSFLLYLTDCSIGGETVLLGGLSGEERLNRLAVVKPKCGRLLIFPHQCPHEGLQVEDVPKLLIRGELCLPSLATRHFK
jgi:2OG-Fe(II) oxygenase superfamily